MRALKFLGVQVLHHTIYNWIAKYLSLKEEYLDRITPQVSDVWKTEDIYLKIRGNLTYTHSP
jgi:transposase-like protein